MAQKAGQIEQLEQLKNDRQRSLLQVPGVTGVGLGMFRGRHVITVYLRKRNSRTERTVRQILASTPVCFKALPQVRRYGAFSRLRRHRTSPKSRA